MTRPAGPSERNKQGRVIGRLCAHEGYCSHNPKPSGFFLQIKILWNTLARAPAEPVPVKAGNSGQIGPVICWLVYGQPAS